MKLLVFETTFTKLIFQLKQSKAIQLKYLLYRGSIKTGFRRASKEDTTLLIPDDVDKNKFFHPTNLDGPIKGSISTKNKAKFFMELGAVKKRQR